MGASLLASWAGQAALLHPALLPSSFQVKSAMDPAAALFRPKMPGLLSPPLRLSMQQHRRSQIPSTRAQASPNITFHFDNTAITIPLSQDAAVGLSKAIENVVNTFREKEKAVRPQRWDSMEYRHTGDGMFVEFFCNPNAYANFFQAKVLITMDDSKMKIVTEAQLSAIKAEVEQYIKAKV